MGLGLLLLAASGKENMMFNANPTITFFKKVYRKSINMSNEVLTLYFKSLPNFGRRLTVNIPKNGDLIKEMTLCFELPDIPVSQHSILGTRKKFAWTNKVAFAMIKYIDIEIGGILISRHYSDWLNINNDMESNVLGRDNMIGKNIHILTDYTNGKSSYILYVPLKFFFNLDNSMALPLIALSKQDVKLHIELNDFSTCYKESPTHYFTQDSFVCLYKEGEAIRQNVDGLKSAGIFVYFDINTKRIYYNMLYNDFLIPANSANINKYNIIGDISQFESIPSISSTIIKDDSYFKTSTPVLKNASVLVNYIYLDSSEQWYFLNNDLEYVVPIILNVLDKDITSINSNYKLQLINPHKVLIWRAQLNSNVRINDQFNYSSFPITTLDEPLIFSNTLNINSIPRTEISNYQYYTTFQNYTNHYVSNKNIYMYTFGLDPRNIEPQGTMNFSMIDDAYLKLGLNNLVNYQNTINIRAYGTYYNLFIIKNGNSSMKYYL